MATTWTEAEAKKTFEAISRKAATDPAFRKLALQNPSAAVKQVSGLDVPAGFQLRFVENQGASMTLVLPDLVKSGGELSDKDLEQVAGGRCGFSCGGSCVMTAVV